MTGIYKFTNILTNEAYIGQSVNIEKRKHTHELVSFRKSSKEYYKRFYQAIRKYGLENFTFEVLEECSPEELDEREIYCIAFYDSFRHGYNMTEGGEGWRGEALDGEKHPNHKLTKEQVYEIRERYNNHEYVYEVYEDYKNLINKTGFRKVWNGYTWPKVHMDVYTEENKEFHKWVRNAHPGKSTGTGPSLSREEIIDIRTRLKTEDKESIWLDYKDKLKAKQNFTDICEYKTYKKITV